MDRDRRWERTKLAYDAIVHGAGRARRRPRPRRSARPTQRGETDEFIEPTVIGDYDGVADGDAVLLFNFRPDRARQLVRALAEPDFDEFDRGAAPRVELDDPDRVPGGLALPGRLRPQAPGGDARRGARRARGAPAPRRRDREVRARHLLLQRRARGASGEGEERCWSPRRATSPPTTSKPRDERRAPRRGSSASAGARAATASGSSTSPTPTWSATPASIPAAVAAVEAVDACLGEVVAARPRVAAAPASITADHGNAEQMLEPDGSPNTAALDQPGAADRHGRRASSCAGRASSPTSPRPCSSCSGSRSRGDDWAARCSRSRAGVVGRGLGSRARRTPARLAVRDRGP